MSSGKGPLRWASGIMIAMGAGHLMVLVLAAGRYVGGWVDRGMWAAVPFLDQGTSPAVESLRSAVTFWSGPGGFAVPLVLLGCLVWHLAERGVAVPAWVGWTLTAWCVLDGVLLGPSPYFAGIVSGALIVLAANRGRPASTATRRELRRSTGQQADDRRGLTG